MEIRIGLARPPKWLIGLIVVAGALGAFMVADRLTLHWYVPDTAGIRGSISDVGAHVNELDGEISSADSKVKLLEGQVKELQSKEATPSAGEELQWQAIGRLSTAVSILSLVQAYGGWQTSTSPAGRACGNWLVLGIGSVTDCGFQHVD